MIGRVNDFHDHRLERPASLGGGGWVVSCRVSRSQGIAGGDEIPSDPWHKRLYKRNREQCPPTSILEKIGTDHALVDSSP